MKASVTATTYHVPPQVLDNETLSALSEEFTPEKIVEKTGIQERRIAAPDQTASDLAYLAAVEMFEKGICKPEEIDYLLFCTQSPDYFLPTSACLLQQRLGLSRESGAMDLNLGCSGFVYGLGVAKGLIESGQARKILFLTGETYSKYIREHDLNVRSLFGDSGSCTLIETAKDDSTDSIGPFIYGTDGLGANHLIVEEGGYRSLANKMANEESVRQPEEAPFLCMNGPDVFLFTLLNVPKTVKQLFKKTGESWDDVDLVVFHQCNGFMLDHLQKKIKIPTEKFYVSMEDIGNTGPSTIPIALARAEQEQKLKPGDRVMLVGFGVGLSWGATMIEWQA